MKHDDDLVTLIQAGPRRAAGETIPPPPPGFMPANERPRKATIKQRRAARAARRFEGDDLRPVVACPCCHRDSYVEIDRRGIRLARHPRTRLLSSGY